MRKRGRRKLDDYKREIVRFEERIHERCVGKMYFFALNAFVIIFRLMSLSVGSIVKQYSVQQYEIADNNTVYSVQYTCTSEDDHTALVWNEDLNFHNLEEPRPESPIRSGNITGCALGKQDRCNLFWKLSEHWNFVNYSYYPTSPVFDSWQKETFFNRHEHEQYVMNMTASSYVTFSVRGSGDLSIQICDISNICSTITIGRQVVCMYKNTRNIPTENSESCTITKRGKSVFNKSFWSTFTLDWNEQNIQVWTERRSLSKILRLKNLKLKAQDLFVRMSDSGLIRFHFYQYVSTTKENVALVSDKFFHDEDKLCIELTVSLCNECALKIAVVNDKNHLYSIKTLDYSYSPFAGLLMWQIVKLNTTLPSTYKGNLTLKIETSPDISNPEKRWAIGYFHKCKPVDAVRNLTITEDFSKIPDDKVKPRNVSQKILSSGKRDEPSLRYVARDRRNANVAQKHDRKERCNLLNCQGVWLERIYLCDQAECTCVQKPCANSAAAANRSLKIIFKLEANQTKNCVRLKFFPILRHNLTVVVNGSSICADSKSKLLDELMDRSNVEKSDEGCITVTIPANWRKPTKVNISIGKYSKANGVTRHCYLHLNETYVFLAKILNEKTNEPTPLPTSLMYISGSKCSEESNVGWKISFFLLAILFALYVWRRKLMIFTKRIWHQNLMPHLERVANDVKSTAIPIPEQPATCVVTLSALDESRERDELSSVDETFEEVESENSSSSISIGNFENYVKESISSGLLKAQFKMLPKGLLKPCTYGLLPENKSKNRYLNIIPYDETRVVLERISNDGCSDYINANYVQGYRKKNAYIAAQGPKSQTVVDFWRMIWQEKALIICMLANLTESQKSKCQRYWPEFGVSETYGNVVVVIESHRVFVDYTFRSFRVSCGAETRKIEHMHYTGWPDHTVPSYTDSIITYLGKLLTIQIGDGPIVVHCSAGIGRTGTLILCDICLRKATVTGKVDVLAEFAKLRDCRLNTVDTEAQYLFVHVVLTECFVSLPTKLPCDNSLPQAIEILKEELPQHIERLNDTAWKDQVLLFSSMTPMPLLREHFKKIRIPELAPASNNLIYLKRYPLGEDNSYYINAVIVDGPRAKKQYIASQLPLPSTLSDFWRLIAEQEVEHVIVLQRPDPKDPTCCDIIADERPFKPVPFLNVEVKTSTSTGNSFIIDELLLTDTSEGEAAGTREVRVLTCTEWTPGKNGKPPPPEHLVDFWVSSQNIRLEERPTLVLCYDGVTGCGLYLALSFLLERMAVERECDIISAVRSIRRSRSDFVRSQEQFEYLYDAAARYIKTFKTHLDV